MRLGVAAGAVAGDGVVHHLDGEFAAGAGIGTEDGDSPAGGVAGVSFAVEAEGIVAGDGVAVEDDLGGYQTITPEFQLS